MASLRATNIKRQPVAAAIRDTTTKEGPTGGHEREKNYTHDNLKREEEEEEKKRSVVEWVRRGAIRFQHPARTHRLCVKRHENRTPARGGRSVGWGVEVHLNGKIQRICTHARIFNPSNSAVCKMVRR